VSTEVSQSFNHGFVLTEQELRRIYDTALQQMKQIVGNNEIGLSFKLKYKNNFTAEKSTIDEVLSETNGGVWEVQDLEIEIEETEVGKKYSTNENKIVIRFNRTKPFLSPITYEIKGKSRDWVYLTASQLDDRIAKIKYFSLDHLRNSEPIQITFFILLIAIVASIVFMIILFLFTSTKFTLNVGFLSWVRINNLIIGFIAVILLAISIITGIYYFPAYNYCWGDNRSVFDRKQSRGKFIIIVLIIGLILSILGSVISTYVTR
jgi:hypothetical protein